MAEIADEDLAVLGYHPETCRMEVLSLHPGVTAEKVREHTGFELTFADAVAVTEPPTMEELSILRGQVDPHRYVIGRAAKGTTAGLTPGQEP